MRRGWWPFSRESATWCQVCGQVSGWMPRHQEPLLHEIAYLHQILARQQIPNNDPNNDPNTNPGGGPDER